MEDACMMPVIPEMVTRLFLRNVLSPQGITGTRTDY